MQLQRCGGWGWGGTNGWKVQDSTAILCVKDDFSNKTYLFLNCVFRRTCRNSYFPSKAPNRQAIKSSTGDLPAVTDASTAMTNPRDSFTHLAHLEKLMLSFLLFLFVFGGPPSPFPALLLLFLGAIMKHGDMRDGVMRGKKSSGLPATRREQGRAVRLCARMCVYPLLSSPLLSRFPTRPLTRIELRGHYVVYRAIQRSKKCFGANAATIISAYEIVVLLLLFQLLCY